MNQGSMSRNLLPSSFASFLISIHQNGSRNYLQWLTCRTESGLHAILLKFLFDIQLAPQVIENQSFKEAFQLLDYGDLWKDAQMLEVVRYLRGSTKLVIPDGWRELLPDHL